MNCLIACSNDCNVGLGRCFVREGDLLSQQTCCNYFKDGFCVETCPLPGTNFVCGEFELSI